jgi:hypothetical protein
MHLESAQGWLELGNHEDANPQGCGSLLFAAVVR